MQIVRFTPIAALILGSVACTTTPKPVVQTPVHWSAAPIGRLSFARSGDTADIGVTATIDSGWHIYAITQPAGGPVAARITLPPGQPFVVAGEVKAAPSPQTKFDENFQMNVQMHEKEVRFDVPIKAAGAIKVADSVRINAKYQACNATLCLPPQTAKLAVPVMSAESGK